MKFFIAATIAALGAAASPVFAEEFCGLWDTTTTGDYILYNNLWGAFDDPSGGQCTGLDSSDGSTIAWHTSFNWAGTSWQVKSFANAALQFEPVQLADVKSIPTTIEYDYKYDGKIVTNVAYDLFTSSTPKGKVEFELMVWLAALGGAWPLSSSGKPVKNVTVSGTDFNLYQGVNGNTTVFSYVAVNSPSSFTADLKEFADVLPAEGGLNSTQYLTHVQCGTEPFIGTNATLTVSKYSAAVEVRNYTLYNNLWGKENDPGTGGQCTALDSPIDDPTSIAWHTNYRWGGLTWNVKGYPNVGLHFDPVELANVESIPTTVNYTYEYDEDVTANMAYDLFTSSKQDGDFEYEIMVWLAAIGTAWLLSQEGKNIQNITVGGVDFMLNHGINGNMTVFLWVATQLTTDFSGDLMEFIQALPTTIAPGAKQFLTKVQCGTEAYHATKNASMVVTSYQMEVNTLMQGSYGFEK
ncbi:hypothetical protein BBP00_00004934 [Phytophthora kernoviae]|uniref:GH16 domain-containing protein n=1 Tax=Phytophthora kernoviae TaxID=325452 RepID=A0A3F2RQ96_9STRA|nr:hypothetical protein BBP00_00004934 [Phytophthora kernoviae]